MNECSDTSDKQSVAAVSSTYQRPSNVPVGSRFAPTVTVRCWLTGPGDPVIGRLPLTSPGQLPGGARLPSESPGPIPDSPLPEGGGKCLFGSESSPISGQTPRQESLIGGYRWGSHALYIYIYTSYGILVVTATPPPWPVLHLLNELVFAQTYVRIWLC